MRSRDAGAGWTGYAYSSTSPDSDANANIAAMRTPRPFAFMHWAKQWCGRLPYCLGASGVPAVSPEELPAPPAPYAEPNYYGSEALRRAVASAQGAAPEGVLISEGTSLANYTALAVLAGPGERILVE
jgi:hypothetical protein